jgi:hypothetical protein
MIRSEPDPTCPDPLTPLEGDLYEIILICIEFQRSSINWGTIKLGLNAPQISKIIPLNLRT